MGGRLLLAGAKSQAIWAGEWHRLITANFLHSGVMHLLFNMYALYVFGRNVEELAGRHGFYVVFIVGGGVGFLSSLLALPDTLSVGASAAVFALMGYTVHFRLRRLPLKWLPVDSMFVQILLLNVIMGMSVPNIDHFAHLGGFVGGFFTAGALGLPPSRFTYVPQQTPLGERLFATLALLLFFWGALFPLSFGGVLKAVAPQSAAAIENRYERYFLPFIVADPALLWINPTSPGGWDFVSDRLRRPADEPVAVAAFWRWVRGGGTASQARYQVTWYRLEQGGVWRPVHMDEGLARRADPGPGRIFRRSMLSAPRADELVGDWRVRVEVEGKVQFVKDFSIGVSSVI